MSGDRDYAVMGRRDEDEEDSRSERSAKRGNRDIDSDEENETHSERTRCGA